MVVSKTNNFSKRFLISIFIAWILFILSLYFRETSLNYFIPWIEFILATIVIVCGLPLIKNGWNSIIKRKLNVFAPIVFSVTIIYIFNATVLLFPDSIFSIKYLISYKAFNFAIVAIITTSILMEQFLELKLLKKIEKPIVKIESPAPIQTKINLVIHYFIIAIFILIVLTYFTWIFIGSSQAKTYGLYSALTLLIITCPLALRISASLPIQLGINKGDKLGIVFKNAESIEMLERVNVILINETDLNSIPDETIKRLHSENIRIVMLTNHNHISKEAGAELIRGIDATESIVSPKQKNETINRLQQQGFIVAIVSDDHETIPTLIISKNIHAASANIILMNDYVDITLAYKLSQKIMNNIRQNLLFIFIYNVFCIPIAIGIFYQIVIFPPIVSVLLMSFSWILVMANGWRLCGYRTGN